LSVFNDDELLQFHKNKSLWTGCFGAMTIITYDFLQEINNKYDLSKLLYLVLSRDDRCGFERVIACILQKEYKGEILLGNIHRYMNWGINFSEKNNFNHLPIIKVWTGR